MCLSPPVGGLVKGGRSLATCWCIYNDPRCAQELPKNSTGVEEIPFGSTAEPFAHNRNECSSPGVFVFVCVCVCAQYMCELLDVSVFGGCSI